MIQRIEDVLRISLNCDTLAVPIGTLVKIVDDLKIGIVTKVGDPYIIGRIIANYWQSNIYTVSTPFTQRNDKAIAGVDITVGPAIFGPDNKVFPCIMPQVASFSGTIAGPFTFATGSSDILEVTVNSGSPQTFTLTNGDTTAIAAIINATAVGFVATSTQDDKLVLSALNVTDTLTVTSASHTADAILGITAATYSPVVTPAYPHPQCMVIAGGLAGNAIEILEC